MAEIKVKLKNADGDILLPASLSDILGHGYGEDASFNETTVKDELDKLLKLMTSSGVTLDDAISALEALNTKSESTHYSSLVDLATFIENFMIDEDLAESVIDTWKELEEFLKGITDQDTLAGLLQLSYDRLTAEKPVVAVGDDEKFIEVTKTDETTTYTNEKGEETETTYPLYTITTNDIASATELANLESTVAGISSDLSGYAKESDLAGVKETAENAASAAATAQTTAESALSAAEAALTTADAATTAASAAQSTADSAATAAANAQKDVGALSESLEDYALKSEIPTKVSELENDSEYITESALDGYAKESDIPTKTSDLTNDSGYITEEALDDYATKEAVEAAQTDATQALKDAATAQDTADKVQEGVDDLKDTVESLGDTYLTITDAADTYATQEALSGVSTVANAAASQANTNAEAIKNLLATGVYYEEITNE